MIAIMIICSLFVQTTAQLAIVTMYELRKDYIAKNLCENRDKPQLKCCGKCYLKKQLNKLNAQHNNSKDNSQKTAKRAVVSLYVLPAVTMIDACLSSAGILSFRGSLQHMTGSLYLYDMLRPPAIVPDPFPVPPDLFCAFC